MLTKATYKNLREYYSDEIINRVTGIIFEQIRRYGNYFKC